MFRSRFNSHRVRLAQLIPLSAAVGVVLAHALPGLAGIAKKPYPAPTGRVHFRTTVETYSMATGKTRVSTSLSVVSWSDHGRKWRKDVSERVVPGQPRNPSWTICDGAHVYQEDPKRPKHAVRMSLAQAKKSGITPFVEVNDVVRSETGKPGNEKVLGKSCDIYRFGPSTYWEWHGTNIVLRYQFIMTESPLERTVATKVELNAKISPEKFRVPAGFKVQDRQTNTATHRRRRAGS